MNLKTPEYQAGRCNIGETEVRRRKISGIIGGVLSIIFYLSTLSLHASKGIRALVFFPLLIATIGWYQSRNRFCLAYGIAGVFNFGKIGHVSRVENPAERSNDRVRALKMLAQAAALAAVIALVCTFVSA